MRHVARSDRETRRPAYAIFMLGLCILSLVSLALLAFFPLSPGIRSILRHVDTAVAVIFLLDFFHLLFRAPNKFRYLVTWGWLDLLSSLPTVGVLRVGRFARVFRILRLLRGFRSVRLLTGHLLEQRAESAFLAVALVALLTITLSSIAILEFETGTTANIQGAEDALWWSFVTMTTVGYGDKYPVTAYGRVVAAFLMIVGIGLFATFTGYLAHWFIEPDDQQIESRLERIEQTLQRINSRN